MPFCFLLIAGALTLSPAQAATFGTPGPEIPVGRGGNWSRIHPAGEGNWWFFQAAGGDYWVSPLGPDLVYDDAVRSPLTGRTNLQDHGIARCPDGTFLHLASGTTDAPNDSLWAWRHSADLTPGSEVIIELAAPERAHNDPVALCGSTLRGAGITEMGMPPRGAFFDLGDSGELSPSGPTYPGIESFMGSAMIPLSAGGFLAVFVSGPGNPELSFQYLSADLSPEGGVITRRVTDRYAFWPQGLLQLDEDLFAVAHMERAEQGGADGNVFVHLLDGDLNILETLQITDEEPGISAQPFLAAQGNTLLVTYTKELQPRVVAIPLDGVDVETPGGDGGSEDTDDDTGVATKDQGCACSHTTPISLFVPLAAILPLFRRRH